MIIKKEISYNFFFMGGRKGGPKGGAKVGATFRLHPSADTLCNACQKQCDVQHVLVECSDYLNNRQFLFDQMLFATSSNYNKLSVQNIDLESILGFDIRLNPKEKKAIFNSLSIFLRNSRVNA